MQIFDIFFIVVTFFINDFGKSDDNAVHQKYTDLSFLFHGVPGVDFIDLLKLKVVVDDFLNYFDTLFLKRTNEGEYLKPIFSFNGIVDIFGVPIFP